jgi:hypothetical protein
MLIDCLVPEADGVTCAGLGLWGVNPVPASSWSETADQAVAGARHGLAPLEQPGSHCSQQGHVLVDGIRGHSARDILGMVLRLGADRILLEGEHLAILH